MSHDMTYNISIHSCGVLRQRDIRLARAGEGRLGRTHNEPGEVLVKHAIMCCAPLAVKSIQGTNGSRGATPARRSPLATAQSVQSAPTPRLGADTRTVYILLHY